jgi:hypothetical protein
VFGMWRCLISGDEIGKFKNANGGGYKEKPGRLRNDKSHSTYSLYVLLLKTG